MSVTTRSGSSNSVTDQYRRRALMLASLLALGGAFFLGRRSAVPASRSIQGETAPKAPAGEGREETGLVVFEEESLKLAGLKVETVRSRALEVRLAVTGTVEPNPDGVVNVTPRVVGKIIAVLVGAGDNVRQGQPLATLASTELAQAQAAYRQAGARVGLAFSNLVRQKKLAGLGEFGRHKVEEARDREIAAHGEINAAVTELAAARNEVSEARSEQAAFEGDVAGAESEAVSADSEITEALGQVRALQAALAQAETGAKVAQSRFNRYDTLLKEQLVSKQDWEQAEADHQKALSDVDAARANLSQGQAKVETARAHRSAAQARVRAAQGRAQQAADKIRTALSREAQTEARLAAAKQRDAIAEEALAREEKVFQGGYLTSKEIAEAEAAWRQAQAEHRAAAENIRLLGGTPGGGNLLTVAAPLAGRVTERAVTLGETVTPEKTLFAVIALNSVWVQLNIYQKDLPSVRMGQTVSLTTDAAPGRTFSGVVSAIGDLVEETTRTVKVRAVVQNPGNVLKPRTFVRGKVTTGVRAQVLAVPKDAVQEMEGKPVVFVAAGRPGEFSARAVRMGGTINEQTVITSGLEPGDSVVTVGAFLVKAQAMKSSLGEE